MDAMTPNTNIGIDRTLLNNSSIKMKTIKTDLTQVRFADFRERLLACSGQKAIKYLASSSRVVCELLALGV